VNRAAIAREGIDSRRAWLTVIGAFLSSGITLGTAYSFGAFFESMAEDFGAARGATAVVFGITTFTFFFLSIGTGRMVDRFGPRPVLLLGAVSLLIGLLATAEVQSLGAGYVTYGAGVGIAAACGYVPMVAVVGAWFERSRALAVGLAVAGIGVGTLVLSPLAASLIDTYGWRDTYRMFAIGGAAVLLACLPLMARPPVHAEAVRRPSTDAFASPVFRRLLYSALGLALGLFVPFVFVGQYAKDQGVDSVQASILVGVLGGSSVLARIGFGSLVGQFGSYRLYRFCFLTHSLSFLVWLTAGSSFALLVVFVAVLGIGYGGFVALSPIVLSDLLGVVGLGGMLGLFYTGAGLGGLVGPPFAGWLIDETGTYRWAIVFAAASGAVGTLLLFWMPVDRAGRIERATTAIG
jgi:MFS family permease